MKNIIVIMMLLVSSQILIAGAQQISPEPNDLNDCSAIRMPIIGKIFSLSIAEENNRCDNFLNPEKGKLIDSREKVDEKEICDFPGACGEPDYNVKRSPIIKLQ